MYYSAMKETAEIVYPDIDYSDLDPIRAYADKYNVIGNMGQDLSQGLQGGIGDWISERHSDCKEISDCLAFNRRISIREAKRKLKSRSKQKSYRPLWELSIVWRLRV